MPVQMASDATDLDSKPQVSNLTHQFFNDPVNNMTTNFESPFGHSVSEVSVSVSIIYLVLSSL